MNISDNTRGIWLMCASMLAFTLNDTFVKAVIGDGMPLSQAIVLRGAVATLGLLVIAAPDGVDIRQIVTTARQLNPRIDVVVRSHNAQEAELLERDTGGTVFVGERELSRAMTRHVLEHFDAAPTAAP